MWSNRDGACQLAGGSLYNSWKIVRTTVVVSQHVFPSNICMNSSNTVPSDQVPSVETAIVKIDHIGKRYGDFDALSDVSFDIQHGEIFGLLGPNGAGKTTLMRSLLGFIRATSGRATIGGYDCWKQRTLAHSLLTYMPAQPQLPRLMRGRDVLRFFADMRPSFGDKNSNGASFERACQLADRLQLDLSRWVALMSTGMRQKLAIAATLCADVPLVFLDEPTANLDPDVRSQLLQELAILRSEGKTVVFSSHVLSEIEQICDRVAVLAKGKLVGISVIQDLKRGSLIQGRIDSGDRNAFSVSEVIQWDENRFQFQTYRRLEEVLPSLITAKVVDLRVQALGLLDVYRQHLAYMPASKSGAAVASDFELANGVTTGTNQ